MARAPSIPAPTENVWIANMRRGMYSLEGSRGIPGNYTDLLELLYNRPRDLSESYYNSLYKDVAPGNILCPS